MAEEAAISLNIALSSVVFAAESNLSMLFATFSASADRMSAVVLSISIPSPNKSNWEFLSMFGLGDPSKLIKRINFGGSGSYGGCDILLMCWHIRDSMGLRGTHGLDSPL